MNGKVIIIGGNKRAGKTTLSNLLHNKYNFNQYNFDMLLDSIETTFEDLDDGNDDKYIELLDNMINRSLEDAKNYGINTLYEYIFTPKQILKLKNINNVKTYFLANLDANENNIESDMMKYSKTYDWPTTATKEDIKRNINYILERNKLLKEECEKYNFRLVNTSREDNRNKILNDLVEEIMKE